jgi:hypothetical protein
MVFIGYVNVSEGIGDVILTHYQPEDLTEAEKANGILVKEADIPKEEMRFGKLAILKVNVETKELFYEYQDRPLNTIEEIEVIKQSQKTASERYADLDVKGTDVEVVRAAKIEQLKELCTEAIYKGFTSASLNKDFGFNDKDQANFSQQYLLVVGGDNKGADINWKTKTGVAKMTEAQFRTLVMESKDHKMTMQVRYWQKEAVVLAATTAEAIDAVVW